MVTSVPLYYVYPKRCEIMTHHYTLCVYGKSHSDLSSHFCYITWYYRTKLHKIVQTAIWQDAQTMTHLHYNFLERGPKLVLEGETSYLRK